MTEVSIRELKNRLTHYLRRLERGEQFTVTRRGKPVAILGPASIAGDETRRKLMELVAKGVIRWNGGKPKGLRPPVKLSGKGPSVSEMIIEDRR